MPSQKRKWQAWPPHHDRDADTSASLLACTYCAETKPPHQFPHSALQRYNKRLRQQSDDSGLKLICKACCSIGPSTGKTASHSASNVPPRRFGRCIKCDIVYELIDDFFSKVDQTMARDGKRVCSKCKLMDVSQDALLQDEVNNGYDSGLDDYADEKIVVYGEEDDLPPPEKIITAQDHDARDEARQAKQLWGAVFSRTLNVTKLRLRRRRFLTASQLIRMRQREAYREMVRELQDLPVEFARARLPNLVRVFHFEQEDLPNDPDLFERSRKLDELLIGKANKGVTPATVEADDDSDADDSAEEEQDDEDQERYTLPHVSRFEPINDDIVTEKEKLKRDLQVLQTKRDEEAKERKRLAGALDQDLAEMLARLNVEPTSQNTPAVQPDETQPEDPKVLELIEYFQMHVKVRSHPSADVKSKLVAPQV